jgi:uncharacterized membrane protein
VPTVETPLALAALAAPLLLVVLVMWRGRRRGHSVFSSLPSRRRRTSVVAVRIALLGALALSLAGVTVQTGSSAQTLVVVADRSASTGGAAADEPALLAALQRGLRSGDRLGVVAAGAAPVVEHAPDLHPQGVDGFPATVDASFTDLESALRIAGSLRADGTSGHVVLASDGRQNVGDAIAEARVLRAEGIRVDVVPLRVAVGPEVRVDALRVPSPVTQQSRLHAAVDIVSTVATTGHLRVDVDGATVAQRDVALPAGTSSLDVELPPPAPGTHRVRVAVDAAQDTVQQNNAGDAVVEVLGAQRVAVVEGAPGAGANLAAAARAAGLQVDVLAPGQLPGSAAELTSWQALALVDVPADALGAARMAALQTAVRDLGIGLAATGGAHAFGPGGLAGTPLEETLPVSMNVSDPRDKQPVAVVLVLESVESSAGDSVLRSAARSVVQHLQPQDFLGVTDAAHGLAVPLTQVGDGRALAAQVDAIAQLGDPPAYDPYITAAATALHAHPEASRHIVVLGDGDADAVPAALLEGLAGQGVTVSAVGVDIDHNLSEMAAMRAIAVAGHGRFYQSENAAQVPDVLLDQTSRELRPWIVEKTFQPALASPSGVLAGVDLASLPDLQGYVATSAKPGATVALNGPQRDPILVEGRYGLGRVVVWTSDVAGRWSAALLRSPAGGHVLANLVSNVLPLAADPALNVTTSVRGATGHVVAQLSGAAAIPDLSTVASLVSPDGSHLDVALAGTGAGRFEADFPAAATGVYVLRLGVSSAGRVVHAATAGLAVAYSPEYRFLGSDGGTLAAIAQAGGGAVLADAAAVLAAAPPPVQSAHALTAALLVASLLLLIADVAVRRLQVRRGDLAVWRSALAGEDERGSEAAAGVAALRERVAERRSAPRPDADQLARRLLDARRRRR